MPLRILLKSQLLLHYISFFRIILFRIAFAINDIYFAKDSYAEIEVSQIKKWDKKAIEKRSKKLLDFLFERWSINEIIASDEDDYQDWAEEQRKIKEELIFPIS